MKNPDHVMKGAKEIWLDGKQVEKIPVMEAGTSHTVTVIMGEERTE